MRRGLREQPSMVGRGAMAHDEKACALSHTSSQPCKDHIASRKRRGINRRLGILETLLSTLGVKRSRPPPHEVKGRPSPSKYARSLAFVLCMRVLSAGGSAGPPR